MDFRGRDLQLGYYDLGKAPVAVKPTATPEIEGHAPQRAKMASPREKLQKLKRHEVVKFWKVHLLLKGENDLGV